MKSNQLVIGFLGVAVLIFAGMIAYKFSHHSGGDTSVAPKTTSTAPTTPANTPRTVTAPPAPTAPATTVKPVKAALKPALNPIFYVQTKMQMLKRGVTAALNSRRLHLEDLDKLSFDTAASTDPYNVFNPNGVIRYAPIDGVWLDQDLIDTLTTKKGTPLVFNVRRSLDKLGTAETLYAVIPNIAPQFCGVGAGNAQFNSAAALTVEPDAHTIVDDPTGMPVIDAGGCVHMPDGRIVWLYNIKQRYQHKGEQRWGSR